ncbi:glycoside hydrolase family 92 protein, partial [bacterium]|nr:glycoside hydrolase family 92 protein [bacterium]
DLELEGGKVLRVRTEGQSAENVYVDAVLWNGVELGRPFLEHTALMQGGELRFRMRGTPKP